ncbi:hypothetical protein ACMHYB_03230 [Sorangium sp. So ce1128]
MQKITVADRLRYRFDLTMGKGAPALIAWLFALSARGALDERARGGDGEG